MSMLEKALNQPEVILRYDGQINMFQLWAKAVEFGVNRALEKCNKLSLYMTKKEAYEASNQLAVERAIKSGDLKLVKKGVKTSPHYILRKDFELWVVKHQILSEPITLK